jgi:hypothetical protein
MPVVASAPFWKGSASALPAVAPTQDARFFSISQLILDA